MILPKKLFIKELKEGQIIDSVFQVVQKELRPKKNSGQFLRLILADKTGDIICNMWDNFEKIFPTFQIDDFVRVRAQTKMYHQKVQLQLLNIDKVDPAEIDTKNYQKSSEKDTSKMWGEIESFIDSITDTHLKTLLKSVFSSEETKKRFISAPAAKALHHAFYSGLLEHTLSLVKLCDSISEHYSDLKINRDLLITGAMLHDLGKIDELSYDRAYNYTDAGRLLGHITIEAIKISKEIEKIDDFPEDLKLQLLHMIISHHGIYEYGSPKRPKTLEALILYYLDDLDAKIESMYKFITENAAAGKWAGFENRQFERFIFKGSLFDPGDESSE